MPRKENIMNKKLEDLLTRFEKFGKETLFFDIDGERHTFCIAIFPISRNEVLQIRACDYRKGDTNLPIDFNFLIRTENSEEGYRIEVISFNNMNSLNFAPDTNKLLSEHDLRTMLASFPIIKQTLDNIK